MNIYMSDIRAVEYDPYASLVRTIKGVHGL